MAKKNEFPQNTHIVPRLEAIIRGYSQCRFTLKNIKQFVMPGYTGAGKEIVTKQIDEALEAAELSLMAIAGEDRIEE